MLSSVAFVSLQWGHQDLLKMTMVLKVVSVQVSFSRSEASFITYQRHDL